MRGLTDSKAGSMTGEKLLGGESLDGELLGGGSAESAGTEADIASTAAIDKTNCRPSWMGARFMWTSLGIDMWHPHPCSGRRGHDTPRQ